MKEDCEHIQGEELTDIIFISCGKCKRFYAHSKAVGEVTAKEVWSKTLYIE